MKRFRYPLLLLVFAAAGMARAADSQLTSVTTILGELRVGLTENAIPFSYKTADSDTPTGHQVDMANQFARDMGVEISLRTGELDSLVTELAKGNIDIIMAGTPMNASLAKRAAFTRPWGMTGVSPVVLREKAGGYQDWRDLGRSSVRIGAVEESVVSAILQSLGRGNDYEAIESSPAAIEALAAGRIDVYLTNTIEASVLMRIDNRLTALFPARALATRPLASLVRIDDPIWLHYVNTWLTIKQETGYLDSLSRKWGLIGQ